MTELSPVAQTVLDAFLGDAEDTGLQVNDLRENVAAALRSAADSLDHATSAHTLHAIADELEGVKYGTYRCELEGK